MSYEINIKRKFDILDKQIQKDFNIKDIVIYKKNYIPSIYMEDDSRNLYSFSMNWKKYIEYVEKEITSNWNYSLYEIWYIEEDKFSSNPISYIEYPIEYIEAWYECPKCWKWHTLEQNWKVTCLECNYSNLIVVFEKNNITN